MTIKELAEFTGKNRTTIQRWISKCISEPIEVKMQNASQYEPSDFTINEVGDILTAGTMSKDAVKILMENARKPTQIITTHSNEVDYEAIGKMIAIAVSSAMTPLINQLQNTTPQPTHLAISEKSVLEFPPVPDISPRKLLNQLVYKYSMSMNIEPQEGWHELHNQFFLRCNDNVSLKARNRNISVIDFLEKENKLLMGCSIMKELIG